MLTYREITTEFDIAERAWNIEESGPQWFRDASHVWTPNYAAFLEFWLGCDQIFGLYDDAELVAIVYLEFTGPEALNIHISVLGRVSGAGLVRFFSALRNQKAADGYTSMSGWIVARNKGIRDLAADAGFTPTGLRMAFGQSRGKVIEWIQLRA